jgi:Tfp pilus assembly protein PilV
MIRPISRKPVNVSRQTGLSILEVVIGIFIFVVGLLALSSLQGALTRSMADAKARTTAAHIAEQTIESRRGFTLIQTDPVNNVFAYNDIVDATSTRLANGVTYSVTVDVTDYYYQLATDTYTTVSTGATASDYKQMEVTVSWNAVTNLRGDEGTELTASGLGSGDIKLTSVIPAIANSASARVADDSVVEGLAPPTGYTPGLRPDIISLTLGNNKFKESLTPEPDVIRADELVETRFDVITYSQTGSGAQFLRREEFAAVSCECTLQTADSDNPARRPVVWAGDEYAGGHFVAKAYGTSANNQQSLLCETCCRDHHDGGTATEDHATDSFYNVFAPFRGDSEYLSTPRASNHKHYLANLNLAGTNQRYNEACRLVRVDGYFRVAQDFRREDQYVFPEDYLDDNSEIKTYSSQVTNSAALYANATSSGYPLSPPCIGDNGNGCLADPTQPGASPGMQGAYNTPIGIDPTTGNAMSLPSWTVVQDGGVTEQQLRSRGVYVDYVSDDLRAFLSDCISNGSLVDGCSRGDVKMDKSPTPNPLEILPFFDVQMTRLDNWTQSLQATLPIDLSNEALENNNTHSRGEIDREHTGLTDVTAKSHRGNLGFTNTLAIDPQFSSQVKSASLKVHSLNSDGSGGGDDGTLPTVIAGVFTELVIGNPTIRVYGDGGATCTLEPNGYSCYIAADASNPTLLVDGYEDSRLVNKENRWACAAGLAGDSKIGAGDTNTTFLLTDTSGSILSAGTHYDIVIQASACYGILDIPL